MLERCEDEQERVRQMQKLRFMITRARMRHQRHLQLEDDAYYDRLLDRLSRPASADATGSPPSSAAAGRKG